MAKKELKEQNKLEGLMLSVVENLESERRFGTAHVYRSTLRSFTLYWYSYRKPCIPMKLRSVFTSPVLRGFEQYLKGRQLSMNTVSTYIRMLRAMYHRALLAKKVSYLPGLFDHLYTGVCSDVKRALSSDDMARLLSLTSTFILGEATLFSSLSNKLREANNWFSLLFLLRGMPFADLARLRKCDYRNGVISYTRQKTRRLLVVGVPKEAETLLRDCADRNPESPYLLSILGGNEPLEPGSRNEYHRYQQVLRSFNYRLSQLSQVLGMRCKLSSYTARHTWATLAFHDKCPVGMISNALGHSSVKVTETYLKPFELEELDRVNRKIISYVNGKTKGRKNQRKITIEY